MSLSLKKINESYEILRTYQGTNPYINYLYNAVYVYKTLKLSDFQAEFVLNNYNFTPIFLNKIITISDWYAEKKQEEWNLDFLPIKLYVGYIIGETEYTYAMYIQYRKSQEKPQLAFIPKKAIITPLFVESYDDLDVDFEKYNEICKNPNIKVKDFQKTAVKFLVKRKKAILADSQGYGKTIESIIAALESGAKKILIICPASLKTNWRNELLNYVDSDKIEIINGKKWKDNEFVIANFDILDNFYDLPEEVAYETVKEADKDGNISVKKEIKWKIKPKYDENGNIIAEGVPKMKISSSKSKIEEAMLNSQLYQSNFDLVIIDEVHKLCNSTSGRYKVVSDFLKRSNPEFIFLLSGTPISNRPYNFYNILKLINADITKDWEYYVKRYCDGRIIYLKGEKWKWTSVFLKRKNKAWKELNEDDLKELDDFLLKYAKHIWSTDGASNLEELKERTKHIYLRRLTSEIQNMVKKNVEVLRYDLDLKQQIKYTTFWEDYLNTFDKEEQEQKGKHKQVIESTLLRQFLAMEMIPNTIELAESILEENSKIIIMCTFDEEIEELKKYFGKKCVVYNGKMTTKKKDEAEQKFKTDDNINVFIGNIIAAGVGLNLQVANIVIFNSFDWVSGSNKQAEDRVYRQTQTNDCTIYYQLFNETFSSDMFDKVLSKEMNINEIIKKENDK